MIIDDVKIDNLIVHLIKISLRSNNSLNLLIYTTK